MACAHWPESSRRRSPFFRPIAWRGQRVMAFPPLFGIEVPKDSSLVGRREILLSRACGRCSRRDWVMRLPSLRRPAGCGGPQGMLAASATWLFAFRARSVMSRSGLETLVRLQWPSIGRALAANLCVVAVLCMGNGAAGVGMVCTMQGSTVSSRRGQAQAHGTSPAGPLPPRRALFQRGEASRGDIGLIYVTGDTSAPHPDGQRPAS